MSEDGKQHLNFTSAGMFACYPQVDELVSASTDDFKLLTGKLTKDWLLCHLKDIVSHLEQAKLSSSHLKSLDEKLESNTEIVSKNVLNAQLDPVSSLSIHSFSWAEVVKKTIQEQDYDKEAEQTIVILNITDFDVINASQSAECTLRKLKYRKISSRFGQKQRKK